MSHHALPHRRARGLLLASLALALATACGGGGDQAQEMPEPDPFISTESPRDQLTDADYGGLDRSLVGLSTPWGRNTISKEISTDLEPATLVGVAIESRDGYDRVIFTFDSRIPGFRVTAGTEGGGGCDGMGEGAGTPAHIAIELSGARASSDASAAGMGSNQPADMGALASVAQTCNEAGTVRWLLGATGDVDYRIMEVRGEPRLVVDLRHP